jgi:hypothetical protein
MSDFTEIINECLAVSAEDFPADRDDVKTWHFTDMQIRHLLARVAERVEETMLDPAKVGEVVAKLSIERDQAMCRAGTLEQENLRLVVEFDDLHQTIQDQAEIIERYGAPPR